MTRFTVDLGPEFDKKLANLAGPGSTKSEVIRRALVAYEALKREEKQGHKVSITGEVDNKILKDVILP